MSRRSDRSTFLGDARAGDFRAHGEDFLFFPFPPWRSGFAAARSGQGRAAFWRGESVPLTARTAAKPSLEGRKRVSFYTEQAMTKKNASNYNLAPTGNLPLSEGQLEPLCRRLNLANTPRIYQQVADRAEKENWSYRDFL